MIDSVLAVLFSFRDVSTFIAISSLTTISRNEIPHGYASSTCCRKIYNGDNQDHVRHRKPMCKSQQTTL